MKKATLSAAAGSVLAAGLLFAAVAAQAQTTSMTPTLYNQGGSVVNSGGTAEPAGYYYNSSGQQIYYYGNGTYYNPSTGTYGGTANTAGTTASPSAGTTGSNVTPTLYNQSGSVVNPNGASEPAGYYYNSSGQQIYYYGNGTYYNPSTGTYGGHAFGTTGTGMTSPGVPNTGAGGEALYTWLALIVSAAVAIGGMAYVSRRSPMVG